VAEPCACSYSPSLGPARGCLCSQNHEVGKLHGALWRLQRSAYRCGEPRPKSQIKKKPAYQTLHSDILKKQSLLLGAAVLECFWFNTVSVAPNRFRRNLILGHHLLGSLLSVASNRFRRNLILGHHLLLWSLLSVASNRFRLNLILGHHLLLWSLL